MLLKTLNEEMTYSLFHVSYLCIANLSIRASFVGSITMHRGNMKGYIKAMSYNKGSSYFDKNKNVTNKSPY